MYYFRHFFLIGQFVFPIPCCLQSLDADSTGESDNRDGMNLAGLLTRLTTFIHEQNLQIQLLIDEVTKNLNQVTKQLEQT
jgi:hypothetical protein